uniref:Uncharacterized protein n=1 Tax=Anguilla anguilla TaxID=7936 RepID=A0A0E9QTQ9_ANGAN
MRDILKMANFIFMKYITFMLSIKESMLCTLLWLSIYLFGAEG